MASGQGADGSGGAGLFFKLTSNGNLIRVNRLILGASDQRNI